MTLPRAALAKALNGDPRVVAAFEDQAQRVSDTADAVSAGAEATQALQDASVLTLAPNAAFTNERVLKVAGGVRKVDDGTYLTLSLSDEAAHVAGGFPAYLTAQGPTNLVLPLSGTLATQADIAQTFVGLSSYANDAAAATGGVPVGGLYRNGSQVMVRVA